jgi:amino acid transporter
MAMLSLIGFAPYAVPATFPGEDIYLANILSVAIEFTICLTYIMLVTTLPRSGGDYVFISRILRPDLGFMLSWAWLLTAFMWCASAAYLAVNFYGSVSIGILGLATGSASLSSWAGTLTTPIWTFGLGSLLLVFMGIICWCGNKWAVRSLTISWVVSAVGAVIMLYVLGSATRANFVSAFNSVSTIPYDQIIGKAQAFGYARGPMLYMTFASLPLWAVWAWSGFSNVSFLGGEIKKISKNLPIAVFGALGLSAVIWMVFYWLIGDRIGFTFNEAIGYMYMNGYTNYPLTGYFPPSLQFFVYILNPNVGITAFLSIAFFISSTVYATSYLQRHARVMFAWSFDQVMPEKLANVNRRFHSPDVATLIATIGSIVALYLWTYTFIGSSLNGAIPIYVTIVAIGISCAALPYMPTKKDIYNLSPFKKYSIARIPVMTIVGVFCAVESAAICYESAVSPAYGASKVSPIALSMVAILFISGFIVYYAARAYRKRMGIDIDLAFREIPPE